MYRVKLLGGVDLTHESGRRITSVLAQPKRFGLLAFLLLEARPTISRDRLLAMFWPDVEDSRARPALNQALHQLRRSLGADCLPSVGHHLMGVDRSCFRCDALDALDGAWSGQPGTMSSDSGLPAFMEGFHISGLGSFQDWIAEQDRALEVIREGLLSLGPDGTRLAETQGRGFRSSAGAEAREEVNWDGRTRAKTSPWVNTRGDSTAGRSALRWAVYGGLIGTLGVAAILGWLRPPPTLSAESHSVAPETYQKYETALELFQQRPGPARERGIALLEEALAEAPEFPEALALLSVHLQYKVNSDMVQGRWESPLVDSADGITARAVAIAPADPVVMAAEALNALMRQRPSLEVYEALLSLGEIGPVAGTALGGYAFLLLREGQWGRAIAVIEHISEANPQLLRPTRWRNGIHLARLDPEVGRAYIAAERNRMADQGFALGEGHYRSLFGNLAWVSLLAGDIEAASALADSAVMEDGSNATFRAIQGDIAFFGGNLEEAEVHYRAATELMNRESLSPRAGSAVGHTWARALNTSLGIVLMRTGRTAEGQRLLSKQRAENLEANRDVHRRLAAPAISPAWNPEQELTWLAVDNAAIDANLGDAERALELLETADARILVGLVVSLQQDPRFSPIAHLPRFGALIEELHQSRRAQIQFWQLARRELSG